MSKLQVVKALSSLQSGEFSRIIGWPHRILIILQKWSQVSLSLGSNKETNQERVSAGKFTGGRMSHVKWSMMLEPQNGRQKVTRTGPFQRTKFTAQHIPTWKQHIWCFKRSHSSDVDRWPHRGHVHKKENLWSSWEMVSKELCHADTEEDSF